MTFNEIQYWRARAERFEAENMRLREALKYYADEPANAKDGPWALNSDDFGDVARAALSDAPPAMDPDTARAWRESDGDHRNHVEDRK